MTTIEHKPSGLLMFSVHPPVEALISAAMLHEHNGSLLNNENLRLQYRKRIKISDMTASLCGFSVQLEVADPDEFTLDCGVCVVSTSASAWLLTA